MADILTKRNAVLIALIVIAIFLLLLTIGEWRGKNRLEIENDVLRHNIEMQHFEIDTLKRQIAPLRARIQEQDGVIVEQKKSLDSALVEINDAKLDPPIREDFPNDTVFVYADRDFYRNLYHLTQKGLDESMGVIQNQDSLIATLKQNIYLQELVIARQDTVIENYKVLDKNQRKQIKKQKRQKLFATGGVVVAFILGFFIAK